MKPNTNIAVHRVPLREIHEVEFSSRCNLRCKYCPHPTMRRAKADMSAETFEQTLAHIKYLCDAGTQTEVSLTGIGEAILHPEFVPWMHRIRAVIGDRLLCVATNGVAMTPELAREMASANVTVYVSSHRPEKAGPAVEMVKAAGCEYGVNKSFVDSAIDWAGQVKWFVSGKTHQCTYLRRAWGAVRQDGSINTCCMDAESKYPIGHVSDPVGTLHTMATKLCEGCHLAVPLEFREGHKWPDDMPKEAQVRNAMKSVSAMELV